jgi:hypothetical protein
VVAVAVAVVITTSSTAAKIAFSAGSFRDPVLFWGRRLAYAAVVSVLLILTAPWSFPRLIQSPTLVEQTQGLKFSVIHRLLIWSFVGAD